MKLGNFNLVSETQNVSSHFFLPPKVNSFTSNQKIKFIYIFLKQNLAETYSISLDCSLITLLKVQKKKKISIMCISREISLDSWAARWELSHLSYLQNWNCLMTNPHSITCPSEHPWYFCALRCPVWSIPPEQCRAALRVLPELPRATLTQLQVPTALLVTPLHSLMGSFGWNPPTAACRTPANSRQEQPQQHEDLPPEIISPL